MTQRSYAQWSLLLGLFFSDALSAGWGTWAKNPAAIPTTSPFVLLKTAKFSRKGFVKPSLTEKQIAEACKAGVDLHAWVTHRVAPDEIMSPEVGSSMGEALAKLLNKTCFSAVELDIEPLNTPPPWLVPFLKAVRAKLPKNLVLRLAIPPVTTEPLTAWAWKSADALAVLDAVDGFDFMIYDTGLKDWYAYGRVITDTVTFISQAPPLKRFVLGFPAYSDRTLRHQLRIENLEIVKHGLKRLPPAVVKTVCSDRVELAFYAYWTARKFDKPHMEAVDAWRKETCK